MAASSKTDFPSLITDAEFRPVTLASLRKLCVDAKWFQKSTTRGPLLERATTLITQLDNAGIAGEVWFDGSYLTEKLNPSDIDLAIRIVNAEYDQGGREKQALLDWATSDGLWVEQRVDGFLLIEYPEDDDRYREGVGNYAYWKRKFGRGWKGLDKGIAVLKLARATK